MRRSTSSKGAENPIDAVGARISFAHNEVIFQAGQPSEHIYKVEVGCIRAYSKLRGNRRVDLAFYFPGDYFGFETRDKHSISAEAVVSTTLLAISAMTLLARSATDVAVARYMLDITSRELTRAQKYRLLLHRSADERVAQFLLAMKKRCCRNEIELIMPRRDIGDHLNLSIESVSRSLTRLHNSNAITLEKWRYVTVNFDRLSILKSNFPASAVSS
jgi:CRP/FNR family nitrogen fixation transcriptional regulator